MSILIKGMEMPKNCWECHFGHGETGICVVDFKEHGDWDEPHDCPLVLIPPHGDLIDRDLFIEFIKTHWDSYDQWFVEQLEARPTVIEAEEGE